MLAKPRHVFTVKTTSRQTTPTSKTVQSLNCVYVVSSNRPLAQVCLVAFTHQSKLGNSEMFDSLNDCSLVIHVTQSNSQRVRKFRVSQFRLALKRRICSPPSPRWGGGRHQFIYHSHKPRPFLQYMYYVKQTLTVTTLPTPSGARLHGFWSRLRLPWLESKTPKHAETDARTRTRHLIISESYQEVYTCVLED